MPSKKQSMPADEPMKSETSSMPVEPPTTPAPVPQAAPKPKAKVAVRKPRAPKKTVVKTESVVEETTTIPAPKPEPEPAPVHRPEMKSDHAAVTPHPVTPPPQRVHRIERKSTETTTETATQTKTSTALTVGVLAASALALAAAAAILSISIGGPKMCVGGTNAGRLCRTSLECGKGGTCVDARIATRTAGYNTPGYSPSTMPARIPKFAIGPAVTGTENSPGIVIASSSNTAIAKIAATTENEDWKVEKLRVSVSNSQMVDGLNIYDGATLITQSITAVSGMIGVYDLTLNWVVPANNTKTLTFKANVKSLAGGARSGAIAKVTLLNTPGTFLARSQTTGATYNAFGYDIVGPEKIIRKSKPVISAVALPTSTLGTGTQTLARFTVTADSSGPVALKKLTFNSMFISNGAPALAIAPTTASGIREVGQSTNIAGQASFSPECMTNLSALCAMQIEFSEELVIAAGTAKTFEFRATVTGGSSSGTVITTTIQGDDSQSAMPVVTGELDGASAPPATRIDDLDGNPAPGLYKLVWSDMSANPHNFNRDRNADGVNEYAASDDWTNGVYAYKTGDLSWTLAR